MKRNQENLPHTPSTRQLGELLRASTLNVCVVGLALVLTACAASNPVYKHTEWTALDGERTGAVVFALPQTRLDFSHTMVTRTFNASVFTSVLDRCKQPPTKAIAALCARLEELGVGKTLRLSNPKKTFTSEQFCRTDGSDKEIRMLVADGSAMVLSAVPDDSEVYVVPLQRSYFQTFDVLLEINANGTVGKGSLSTENLGAEEVLSLVADVAGNALNAMVTEPPILVDDPGPRPDYASTIPPLPDSNLLKAASAAILQMETLAARRNTLAAQDNDQTLASRAATIAVLDARLARLTRKFTGELSEQSEEADAFSWIPSKSDAEKDAEKNVEKFATSEGYDACGQDPAERPRRLLVAVSTRRDGLAPLASGTLTAASMPEARGWPYRVPREAMVGWALCGSFSEQTGTPPEKKAWLDVDVKRCAPIDGVRTLMPQFGITLRLPEATGGRKSAVASEYHADGSLKKITVEHVGTSPKPLVDNARSILLPPPSAPAPTETATLTAQVQLIATRQSLCRLVHDVGEGKPPCTGSNPPTTLGE